jgi:hypothetical protein
MLVGLALGLVLVAGMPGSLAPAGASHGGVAPAAAGSGAAPTAAVHPSVVSPVQASAALVTALGTYTTLPTTLVVSLSVTNTTFTGANAALFLNVTDYTASNTLCDSNDITSLIAAGPGGTQYLTFPLTTSYFANVTVACPNFLVDQAYINITMFIWDATNGSATATAVQNSYFQPITAVVLTTPTSQLVTTPTTGQQQTYSFSATYSAQYVGKVQLSVFNPTGGLAFQANLRWNGTTPTVVTWHQTVSGVYPYILGVYTAYGTFNTSGSVFVPALTPIYYNNATYHNTTLIPGLSSGAAGTILLVVGLIVGMLVATVVGRLVWGGAKPSGPAQPWTQQSAAGNVCSVCGKSFATPEELAAHSKSEHGMQ